MNLRTKVVKRGQFNPASPPSDPDVAPALPALRERIADLRVRSDAARQQNAAGISLSAANAPMVAIFQTPIPETAVLTTDRDVQKREEQIRKLLCERGPRRLLGAVAGPALAERLTDLYRTHPNFSAAIDVVVGEEQLARQRGSAITGLRLLLTGKPGVGKTDFSQTLSNKLGVPMVMIAMGTAQSSSALGGAEVHWGNTRPGQIFQELIQHSHANPVVVLDELEKCHTHWGDPAAALYQLLESRTAARFTDKSVPWLEVDASMINWVATVNDVSQLHEAIVSRFIVIEAGAPPEAQLRGLVQSLYSALLAEFALTETFPLHLDRQSEDALIGGSIRDAKRRLRTALGEALRIGAQELVITPIGTPAVQRRIGFV